MYCQFIHNNDQTELDIGIECPHTVFVCVSAESFCMICNNIISEKAQQHVQ